MAAAADPPVHATFDEVFRELARIALEEPDTAVISKVEYLVTFPDGRLAVIDEQANQVRVYAPDGELLHALGRYGSGPAELKRPFDLAVAADGRVYVMDRGNRRVSRWDEDLAFDTVFPIRGVETTVEVDPLGSRLVVGVFHEATPGDEYIIYSPDGERVGGFHPQSPLIHVPYWGEPFRNFLVVGREALFAVNSMTYPIYRYTLEGEAVDSFGTPPPSYTAPSRPVRGQFMGIGARLRYESWMRTFTTADGLALYRDSLLLVEHRRLDPNQLSYREGMYRLDIYDVHGGGTRKRYEDIALPGPLLHADSAVYLLVGEPPGPWTIGRYGALVSPP